MTISEMFLERIAKALESIDSRLDSLIHTAEDGGSYITVELLDSEDDEDEE